MTETTCPSCSKTRDLDDYPRRMTVDEARQVARVCERTIRRWIDIGVLRANRPVGGKLLIDRESLRALLEGGQR